MNLGHGTRGVHRHHLKGRPPEKLRGPLVQHISNTIIGPTVRNNRVGLETAEPDIRLYEQLVIIVSGNELTRPYDGDIVLDGHQIANCTVEGQSLSPLPFWKKAFIESDLIP